VQPADVVIGPDKMAFSCGGRHVVYAVIFAVLAWQLGGAGWALLRPAASFGLVAVAYPRSFIAITAGGSLKSTRQGIITTCVDGS
jgi:hypothetical protein